MFFHALISTAIKILIGWIVLSKVPVWLNISGIIAAVIKVIGILIIISSLADWI